MITRRGLLRFLPFLPTLPAILSRTPSYGPSTVVVGRMEAGAFSFSRRAWDIPGLVYKAAQEGGGYILNRAGTIHAFVLRNGDLIDFGPHVKP